MNEDYRPITWLIFLYGILDPAIMPSWIISGLALLTLGATLADLPCHAEADSLGPTISRTAARAAQANLERSDSVDHTSLLKR
jgi:hypothetical protein